ncbi:MAG TPA: RdgB/HAM1 family non-canonical purine NTP pyrophosphatase [Planctomycetota bacterium]|nr:RdgB/HAM1 family non-canonical purine NTP pyrophosphatase [Planctomycetota bacterium]
METEHTRNANGPLLLVGSGNSHKVDEIAEALSGVGDLAGRALRVAGSRALPPGPEPDETGATFHENAHQKAVEYAKRAGALQGAARPRWVLSDDSGLVVDCLDGAPGVRSARYAGEEATDALNNQKLLRELQGVSRDRRGAEFICVLSLVKVPDSIDSPAAEVATAEGRSRGEILLEAQGEGGFGYDPLFFVPELSRTFAELTRAEKNAWSHRGRALRVLRERLQEILARSP